jgi:hypothetical protein
LVTVEEHLLTTSEAYLLHKGHQAQQNLRLSVAKFVADVLRAGTLMDLHWRQGNDMWMSYGLWVCVFGAKLAESYFFLTLSFKDPLEDEGN